jgi:hypothetical protein
MIDNNPAWTALCDLAKLPWRVSTCPTTGVRVFTQSDRHPDDHREPWDIITTKAKPIKARRRKITLARAMKQASKAGVSVRQVMVKPEGVELQLGETVEITPNEWDSVQ